MSNWIRPGGWLLLVVLCAPTRGFAEKPAKARAKQAVTSPEKQTGKVEFDRATKYFEAEEYAAALPLFQKAYELSNRRPATIFSLAQCERALKKYDEAIAHFEEYLATKPTPKDKSQVQATLGLLREQREQARRDEAKAEAERAESARLEAARIDEEKRRNEAVERERALQAAVVQPPPVPAEESSSIVAHPAFWGAVGVVVVGAVVVGFVALSGEADPYSGSSGVVLGK